MAALAFCSPVAAGDFDEARVALYERYAAELEELAQRCDARELADEANRLRHWPPEREPAKFCLFVIDRQAKAEPADDEWQQRFRALRRAQAEALVELARRAVKEDRVSLVPVLLTEAVREDPDHGVARQALGYEKYGDAWCTSYAKRMLEDGRVWHEEFGWLPEHDVKRYETGLRPFGSQWIDAREDARRRRHITSGWLVETDHYRVTTNHSLEEGVRLAAKLERLNEIWRQLFAGFLMRPVELERMLDGRPPSDRSARRHEVVYYRSEEEYYEALRPAQPKIHITLGIYFDNRRRAYFFAGEKQHTGTLYHEATHQLFQETRPAAKNIGRQHNFWIIEGIAAYFESLTEHDGYFAVGGLDAGRVPAARQRLLEGNFYVPLAELTQMGMQDVQRHPEIAKLYSQSAGLATFFMHAEGGRYRDALVEYLAAVYSGKDQPGTLADLTGSSYEELDRQYREFLKSGS